MHAQCSGPLARGVLSSRRSAVGCAVLSLALLAFCGGKPLCAQQSAPAAQSASSPKPASGTPAATADHFNEDTLDTTPPDELNDDGNPDDQQTAPIIVTAPRLPDSGGASAAAAAPVIEKPVPASAGGDARRQQINDECANLLMLANMLKAEVEKTTKDELSVPVVRKAGEIEQLARKVRDEMRPVLSSENSGARP
jgi:hypothetical protein